MQFNLFDWIREGVSRSVILGVSDAMEAIGSPEGEDGRARLRASAAGHRRSAAAGAWPLAASASGSAARSAISKAASNSVQQALPPRDRVIQYAGRAAAQPSSDR